MKKIPALLALTILLWQTSEAQLNRYIIQFKNKGGNSFSLSAPLQFLSQRAIDRRTRYNIAIDSADLPVTPQYMDSVRLAGSVTILNASKWLNSVTIRTTDAAALAKIAGFPFVVSAVPIAARLTGSTIINQAKNGEETGWQTLDRQSKLAADVYNYGASGVQIKMHKGEFLHNIGLRGQNMRIGILDGGFNSYLTLNVFDSARTNGQILNTWDFVAGEASVVEDNAHGMQCFSVIAANLPGQFVGSAPRASYYLFRTEDVSSEYQIEEHNWVCGAERVDSSGGDLISSSLGYSDGMSNPVFNHTYAEMNGNTTMAARGADMAAKKGLLVVNAAGNQGTETFKYLSTPADSDSVLAVGAVNSQGSAASFTSLGPSSDGQVKPDVASLGVGTTIATTSNTIGTNNGTSFAAPNIAGLAACLWQGFPEANNMKIIAALRQAGSRAVNPNDSIGYGIPDLKVALLYLLKDVSTASGTVTNCKSSVSFSSKDVSSMRYELERKTPGQSNYVKVNEVQARGGAFGTQSYQLADSLINVNAGIVSYRIRQVIDTSVTGFSADYIDTVSVQLSVPCILTAINPISPTETEWKVVPNPANNVVTLGLTTPQAIAQLTIKVTDAKGRQVLFLNKSKPSASWQTTILLGHLPKGEYFVSLYDANRWLGTRKLMKL